MPDEITPETEATTETEAAPEAAEVETELTPEQLKAELAKVRREAAKYRTDLRAAEPFVAKARELEEASKTEAQKLAEAHKSAEERATAAEARLARLDVCLKVGLDPKFAGRLQGTTPEELEADAKELAGLFPAAPSGTSPDPGRKPRARLDSARPNAGATDESTDPDAIAARALKRGMY